MTQTDRLRAMLDERGVEWRSDSENITFWNTDADVAAASQGYDGMLWVSARLTPEQAIAATLGAGTCKNLANHQGCTEFVCSECGTHYLGFRFKYCPGCGAKVVEG